MTDTAIERALSDAQIKHMVNRFLQWRLPQNFNPDCGISYTVPNHPAYQDGTMGPVGTNLLDFTQAEAMVRHMVDGLATLTPPTEAEAQPGAVREAEAIAALELIRDRSYIQGHTSPNENFYGDIAKAALARIAEFTPAPIEPTDAEAREVLAWDWLDDEFGGDGAVEDRDYSADEMVSAFISGRCRAPLAFATTRPAAAVEPDHIGDANNMIEALQKSLEFACLTLAFIGRDQGTKRIDRTLDGLCKLAIEVEKINRAAFSSRGPATATVCSTPDGLLWVYGGSSWRELPRTMPAAAEGEP